MPKSNFKDVETLQRSHSLLMCLKACFVLFLITGLFCGAASAYSVSNAQDLSNALNASSDSGVAAYVDAETGYVILTDDVHLDEMIDIRAVDPIVLTTESSSDHVIYRNVAAQPLIILSEASALFLEGRDGHTIILDGNKTAYSGSAGSPLVHAIAGGGLYLNTGSILQNSSCSGDGAAVHLSQGMLILRGGIITGNEGTFGGAVYVEERSLVEISRGTIANNTARSNGGAVAMSGGTLLMSGGTITNNTATGFGGGVYMDDLLAPTVFTMDGGTIANNTALGISDGGGVCVGDGDNTFTLNNGVISGNTATRDGGGVYLGDATFSMSSGTISGNTAAYDGGGVMLGGGHFTMSGGNILSNTAARNGDGVFVSAINVCDLLGSATVNADNDVYLSGGGGDAAKLNLVNSLANDAGVLNITPKYTSDWLVVHSKDGVTLPGTWSSNFRLNTTWAAENPTLDLGQSGNDILLGTRCTVKFWIDDMTSLSQNNVTGALLAQPADPKRSGYTFNGWNNTSVSGTPWNFASDRIVGNTDLYANWTLDPTPTPTPTTTPTVTPTVKPTSSGGGSGGNNADAGQVSANGNYVSKDGGLIIHYPAGSSVIVTVFQNYLGGGVSAPPHVSYLNLYDVYSTAQRGTQVTLSFKVNASQLDALDLLPKDISILHYYNGKWYRMSVESVELVDGAYWFTVTSTHTSPFMVAYNIDGSLFPLEEDDTSTPSETPTTGPTQAGPTDVVPTTTSTPIPTKTPSSPVPFIGIIAGLGAVVLLMRRT